MVCVMARGFPQTNGGPQTAVMMVTSSKVGAQGGLDIVQRSTIVSGRLSPVIMLEGEEGSFITALPEITVHRPVPAAGVFPASVVKVESHATSWSGPAFACAGCWLTRSRVVSE